MTAFEEMGVLPEIAKAVEEMGWTLPTDIQNEAIPLVLGGGDVLMAAETGSGKTGAFCLPIIQTVWETLKDLQSGKVSKIIAETSPLWTMSFFDRDRALAVTPDGLRCQSREQREWHGGRATKGVTGYGRFYYEATVTDEGLCRVGWSTPEANLDLGTCRTGYGFGGTGRKSNSKQFDEYGEPFGKSDVIGCLLDLGAREIRFSKNGIDLGRAFMLSQNTKTGPFFPAVVLKNAEMSFNFGDLPLKHLPAGFTALSAAPCECVALSRVGCAGVPAVGKNRNAPQAIVVEPSRELAEQTFAQFQKFSAYVTEPTLNTLLVVGSIHVQDQIAALNSGVDIVVATPGRLEDLVSTGQLMLTQCRFFVLDEADGLLKQGYKDLVDRLHRQMPKITSDGRRLQMIVCSATLHDFEVKKLSERLMHFPTWVDLKGEDSVPETVHHVVVRVDPQTDDTWRHLSSHIATDGVHARDNLHNGLNIAASLSEAVKILKGEYCLRAIREHKMDRAIIFCRTKIDCDNLEQYLEAQATSFGELSCVCLHGDRMPHERKKNLELFKRAEVRFLVCTDVAARGLDIVGLPFMINVTLPDEKSSYVHRIGRVGRAERMGLAISLVATVPEKVWYHGQWCSSRGKSCDDTRLTDVKGCCVWYNELGYLAEIEDHLNVTIQEVGSDVKVPANEFDGKVTYGQKRMNQGTGYVGHAAQMAPAVEELAKLESRAQLVYLQRHFSRPAKA